MDLNKNQNNRYYSSVIIAITITIFNNNTLESILVKFNLSSEIISD